MRRYPVFLNLAGRSCLVVGAGPVGRRKAQVLAECGPAEVLVVDPAPASPELLELTAQGPVTHAGRPFQESDLDGRLLVFAATGDPAVNERIQALCQERGILCNRVETPLESGFIVPSHIRRGDLILAVSTGGASPALSRKIRRELEAWFGVHYESFLRLMAALRPMVLDLGLDSDANADIFRALTESELLDALRYGDRDQIERILQECLPQALHPRVPEVLDGI